MGSLLESSDEMSTTKPAVLVGSPILSINSGHPFHSSFGIRRKSIKLESTTLRIAISASNSTATLDHGCTRKRSSAQSVQVCTVYVRMSCHSKWQHIPETHRCDITCRTSIQYRSLFLFQLIDVCVGVGGLD